MKKKLMRTLLAGVLACALILPTACNTNTPGGENPGGENPGGNNPGGQVTETASLSFGKSDISLKVGATEDVTITATKIEDISFESNKPQVATAKLKEDKTALTITAVGQGSAKITAKAGGKDLATLTVNVTQDVAFTTPTANQEFEFDLESTNATIPYTLNDSSAAANVTATSEHDEIATVSVDLQRKLVKVSPVTLGETNITITTTNGSSTANVMVKVTITEIYQKTDMDLFSFNDNAEQNGYIVSLKDKAAFIENEENTVLVLPSEYNSKPVTEVAENFLKDDAVPALTDLYIPASIKVIGKSAFEGCANLANVHIKSGNLLETVSESAFEDCKALSSFDGLTKEDFSGCTHLTTIGARAFYQHHFEALYIPKSVTTIGTIAFAQNYFSAYAGDNATVLEMVEFEKDDNAENAVSLLYGPKLATDPTGIVLPYDQGDPIYGGDDGTTLTGWTGTFDPINGAFANNTALSTVYLRNIKFCASLTFYNCALTEIYIDETCATQAFAYDATKGNDDGMWITGCAFYYAFPENNGKLAGATSTPEEHKTVLVIDNAAMMTTVQVPSPLAFMNDSLSILGFVDNWQGITPLTAIWYVYVKEGIEPSDSFKTKYEQQDSEKDGYTYWVWKAQ